MSQIMLKNFYEPREKLINFFDKLQDMYLRLNLEQLKENYLKIFALKQMRQRLPIALGQVKASNSSKNLLN